jgi:hypothetical protein
LGVWGLGPHPKSPIPNPQSPSPIPIKLNNILKVYKIYFKNNILYNKNIILKK